MIFEKKKFIDFIKLQRGYDLTKDEIVEERYQKFRKISGFKEV